MAVNPVLKPKLATVPLVLVSAAVLIGVVLFLVLVSTAQPWSAAMTVSGGILLAITLALAAQWWTRAQRQRAWLTYASDKWATLNATKLTSGTTTEITVLSVDEVQPTGSWITINWNHFGHVQSAWLEALPEPIWPGSVLLMAPDSAQVRPGVPWPETYLIRASSCLAWAPAAGWHTVFR